jgi:hypothetical protein
MMSDENVDFEEALLKAVQRAEQASIEASIAAKKAENAAIQAKDAARKVKKAKNRVKATEKEIVNMQELADEKSIKYQEEIIEIISKAKKKHKALKKIAKLNAGKKL